MVQDVRMRGFERRHSVADALGWLTAHTERLGAETVPVREAACRILATDVTSEVSVPGFVRSMMDGFAVVAADTLGASSYNRLELAVMGQSMPGDACDAIVSSGRAVRIMTGAPMPAGADAVLPVEWSEIEGSTIYATAAVSIGKNVAQVGEDVAEGDRVLEAGRRLRPQDVGVLSSIGAAEIQAVRRPRVRILVTGNELLPPGSRPTGDRIVDANSPMLEALVARDGGIAMNPGIVPDRRDAITSAMRDDADVVLVSGGSSVGQEDLAPMILAEQGDLAIHGIAMRPSSPAGMGRLAKRLVFLLPGNPVSCLCAYDFFAGRAIRVMGGGEPEWPYTQVTRPLARKLVSKVGRVDYARVRLSDDQVEPLAISGASILSSTTRADGFVVVPESSEGFAPGTAVDVWLY